MLESDGKIREGIMITSYLISLHHGIDSDTSILLVQACQARLSCVSEYGIVSGVASVSWVNLGIHAVSHELGYSRLFFSSMFP